MTRKISRRRFLGEASCTAVGSSSLFSTLMNLRMTNTAAAQNLSTPPSRSVATLSSEDDYKALVCVFLAGGNDSFNMLVPRSGETYDEYATIRSDLALPSGDLLPLDFTDDKGRSYGLHPSMPEVANLFNDGEVAFLTNVGTLVEPTTKSNIDAGLASLPLGLYSHSDQIMHWQTSVPDKRTGFGWGGRTADLLHSLNENDQISMNISLSGSNLFQTGQTLTEYTLLPNNQGDGKGAVQIWGHDQPWTRYALQKAAIESMLDLEYQNLFDQTFANMTTAAINSGNEFVTAIESLDPFTTTYSDTDLSHSLHMVAKTIALQKTLGFRRQVFFVLMGGWDHHDEVLDNQVEMLSIVSKGLKEFSDTLKELDVYDQVTTFTASDFGRTLSSNGKGSDHAWGGNHMVMGGSVRGQEVFGEYPDLYADNPLDTGRGRLIPTTSCDEYFAELALWFGVDRTDLSAVLPNIGRFYDINASRQPLRFMSIPLSPSEITDQVFLPQISRP